MKDIAIYGAGGFGREVACLIRIINEKNPTWNLIGFFDDGIEKGTKNEYGEVLGGITEVNNFSEPLSIVIAIANPKIVSKIVTNITNLNVDFPFAASLCQDGIPCYFAFLDVSTAHDQVRYILASSKTFNQ